MRREALFVAVAALTAGLGAMSAGSAFAQCLTNQEPSFPLVTMAHNFMSDSSLHGSKSYGFRWDLPGYQKNLAKGNACPAQGQVTQQSAPVQSNYYNPYGQYTSTGGMHRR